jgi:hypothetical protein
MFHHASARVEFGNPSLTGSTPSTVCAPCTDGRDSLRYRQGIVVRQRPPLLANLLGNGDQGKRARFPVIKRATMIAHPAIPSPDRSFTLNDLRVPAPLESRRPLPQ